MGRSKKTRDVSLTYETLPALFTGICDAIRSKTGSSDLIDHQDIPTEIAGIQTGSSVEILADELLNPASYSSATKTLSITKAGTLHVCIMKSNSLSSPSVANGETSESPVFISFGDYPTVAYYSFTVAANTTVTITSGNVGAGGANAYVFAVLDGSN